MRAFLEIIESRLMLHSVAVSKGRRALKASASRSQSQRQALIASLQQNAAKGGASRPASPPPAKPLYVPKPCLLCKRLEPKSMLAQCRNCALSCHACQSNKFSWEITG